MGMFDHRERRIDELARQLPASMCVAIVEAREDQLTIRVQKGVYGGTVRGLRTRGLLHQNTKALTPLGIEVRAALSRGQGLHP